MALLDSQKFYENLSQGVFDPLYLIVGEEEYLLKQAFNYLKNSSLAEHEIDFNFQVFQSADLNMDNLKDSLQTLPMMAARRVVILRDIEELKDKEWEELLPFFEKPIESTLFALIGHRIDKRKKAMKVLTDKGTFVEFKKIYENQVPSWVRYIADSVGVEIDENAIHELHRRVGSGLLEIESSLMRLKDFMDQENRITLALVEQVISRTKEESIFDLIQALALGQQVESLEILVGVLDQGQNEIGLLALLARHFRILYQMKKAQAQGIHGAKLAQQLQIPTYFMNQYLEQGNHWSDKKIESVLVIISETDQALKSSPLSSHIWLENLVLKICSLSRQAGHPLAH